MLLLPGVQAQTRSRVQVSSRIWARVGWAVWCHRCLRFNDYHESVDFTEQRRNDDDYVMLYRSCPAFPQKSNFTDLRVIILRRTV